MKDEYIEDKRLYPCPFCGNRIPKIKHVAYDYSRIKMYWVLCDKCSATFENISDSIDDAVNMWNRRTK